MYMYNPMCRSLIFSGFAGKLRFLYDLFIDFINVNQHHLYSPLGCLVILVLFITLLYECIMNADSGFLHCPPLVHVRTSMMAYCLEPFKILIVLMCEINASLTIIRDSFI